MNINKENKDNIWLIIIFSILIGFLLFSNNNDKKSEVKNQQLSYNQFINNLEKDEYVSLYINNNKNSIVAKDKNNKYFKVYVNDEAMKYVTNYSTDINIETFFEEKENVNSNSFGGQLIISLISVIIMCLFIFYLNKKQQGGVKANEFSKAKIHVLSKSNIKFSDVAGCDEAKEHLKDIVDYLKNSDKYNVLGARLPRGALLVGSPGTGKTLLGKAVAGEADVPFFYLSGADFVEMFVGVGSARVRDLFQQAKKTSKCIIFIDEIDAIGKKRGVTLSGNDEREQTLNQLLVEMDGFETDSNIIVLAATNRPELLDPALLRPGRFDKKIFVDKPDLNGRSELLQLYLKKVNVDSDINIKAIAKGIPGFTGADISNLVNQATIITAKNNRKVVTNNDLEKAKDFIIMGDEKKNAIMTDKEKTIIAYHESGHAIISSILKDTDAVHKVSIIPRGRALGVTVVLPEEEKNLYSKDYLLSQIAMLYGGRIAEEIFIGSITTGASDDIKRATEIATKMVKVFGMGVDNKPIMFNNNEEEHVNNWSDYKQQKLDEEIEKILEMQYNLAKDIILENKDKIEKMKSMLIEKETIDVNDVNNIMNSI